MEDLDVVGIEFELRLRGFQVWSVQALDTDRLALGCGDGFIRIVSRSGGRVVKKLEHNAPRLGKDESNTVNYLACDPIAEDGDDAYVSAPVLASASESGYVHLWDRDTLEHDAEILAVDETVASVSLSTKYVAAASFDNNVRVFSRGGRGCYSLVHTISVHTGPVACVFVCPHSSFVLSAAQDGLCYLTDVEIGEQLWKCNMRMFKKSPEIDPSEILLLKDGRVAVTVVETRSNDPVIESIELRIWNTPSCLQSQQAASALVGTASSLRDEQADANEPAPQTPVLPEEASKKVRKRAHRSAINRDEDDDMITPVEVDSAVKQKSSGKKGFKDFKRLRQSVTREVDGAVNASVKKEMSKSPSPPKSASVQLPLESCSSESLLKQWSEHGLHGQGVSKMGRTQLASALAAFMVDLDVERLEEFKVLERALQGYFVLSKFSTSALKGDFGLSPGRFAFLLEEGVGEWAKKEGCTFAWSVYYDPTIRNFINDFFKF